MSYLSLKFSIVKNNLIALFQSVFLRDSTGQDLKDSNGNDLLARDE